MKVSKIKTIYRKEMLDLLRDKKTLIMMVLVPLLLYPLIMVAALLISSAVSSTIQESEYDVVLVEEADADYNRDELVEFLEDTEDELEYHLNVVECEDPESSLQAEEIDTYVIIGQKEKQLSFEVCYLSSVTNSSAASDMVIDKLRVYREQTSKTLLTDMGLDAEYLLEPVAIVWEDKASKEESVGNILGKILPFLLITSILMGALYPAIDTTAGEKERGTLETLLTLPVRNDELIMGKFLAVATVSVVSALLNLISMALMGGYLLQVMNASSKESLSVDLAGFIPAMLIVVLCVVAFALFISAITMCVTAFAKSFKEANNYTTPLLLVVMLTGYIGFIPNIEFTPVMAAVPVVNICLLIGNLLVFKYEFSLILIVLVTNVAYAAISVMALSKIYDSEDILFGESGVNLQMFTRRKDLKRGDVPNLSDAVLVAAVSILMLLYVGSLLQLKFPFMGLLFTQLLIIGVPVLATWYTKKDYLQTFSLKLPRITGVIGAVFLEVGVFAAMAVLSVALAYIWPQDVQSVNESFMIMLEGVGFVPALLVIALAPAICEETLFRGYLLAAVKKKCKPFTAILLVGALFGIYHLNLVKFFTTGLLGVALCYAAYKSGSIFLSCLMHFINNAISVVVIYYGPEVEEVAPILFQETLGVSDTLLLLSVALICSALGMALIKHSSTKR
ncbi:MAG: CPBP family intramembrane metalloprotease [Lachnospiraceae bacterium]|nr:CPBP family intramembrane metalloprotease [Lachnospiraceae bacterium]